MLVVLVPFFTVKPSIDNCINNMQATKLLRAQFSAEFSIVMNLAKLFPRYEWSYATFALPKINKIVI